VKIRTVIVDDEELARRGLRALSQRCEDVELVCECRNGREASTRFTGIGPDLVFWTFKCRERTGSMSLARSPIPNAPMWYS